MSDPIETLWEEILSRQSERIQAAFATLSAEEKVAVLDHLNRMASEPGWHPEQIASASKALKTLNNDQ
jgi:hypothetical protein